ncbi:YcgL domain-containing protein [Leucothrix sargassi]|nr:YcgL domain-containing protein [Leucothrix sargassi]
MSSSVECHVYRSKHKNGMYIYLTEKDDFDSIPEALRKRVGLLEFSFSFTLTEARKLVRYDTKSVIKQLQETGFFLQMPPPETNFLDLNLHQSDGF